MSSIFKSIGDDPLPWIVLAALILNAVFWIRWAYKIGDGDYVTVDHGGRHVLPHKRGKAGMVSALAASSFLLPTCSLICPPLFGLLLRYPQIVVPVFLALGYLAIWSYPVSRR